MNSAHTDKCAVPVVSAKEVERLVKLNDVGNEKNKVAYLNTKKNTNCKCLALSLWHSILAPRTSLLRHVLHREGHQLAVHL